MNELESRLCETLEESRKSFHLEEADLDKVRSGQKPFLPSDGHSEASG